MVSTLRTAPESYCFLHKRNQSISNEHTRLMPFPMLCLVQSCDFLERDRKKLCFGLLQISLSLQNVGDWCGVPRKSHACDTLSSIIEVYCTEGERKLVSRTATTFCRFPDEPLPPKIQLVKGIPTEGRRRKKNPWQGCSSGSWSSVSLKRRKRREGNSVLINCKSLSLFSQGF